MRGLITLIGSIGLYLFAFLLGALGTYFIIDHNYFAPVNSEDESQVSFIINGGETLTEIAKKLEQQGLIKSWWSIYIMDKLKGESTVVYKGEFALSTSLTPKEILNRFSNTEHVIYHKVSIPEGTTLAQISRKLVGTGLTTENELSSAINDSRLIAELEVPSFSFEGFLFPETYQFTRPTSAKAMISHMVKTGKEKLVSDIPNWEKQAELLGLSLKEIVTLASIIEKETGKASERETISSVFHNRLRIGMPLQSDPTVIYGISNFNGNLTKKDLKTPGPYNTYINNGLPPTPICNPGIESIAAALYPAETDYLYFVSKGDGSHKFSASYKEHRAAVNKYQRRL